MATHTSTGSTTASALSEVTMNSRMPFLATTRSAAVAVSVTAAIPGVFGWLHAISPLKPALDGVRAVVTGESLVAPIGQLLTWTIVAVGLGIAAIARHRSLTPASFLHLTKASAPS